MEQRLQAHIYTARELTEFMKMNPYKRQEVLTSMDDDAHDQFMQALADIGYPPEVVYPATAVVVPQVPQAATPVQIGRTVPQRSVSPLPSPTHAPPIRPGVFDQDGFDQDGFDQDGFDRGGFDRDGFDQDGFDQDGFDRNGFDRDGTGDEVEVDAAPVAPRPVRQPRAARKPRQQRKRKPLQLQKPINHQWVDFIMTVADYLSAFVVLLIGFVGTIGAFHPGGLQTVKEAALIGLGWAEPNATPVLVNWTSLWISIGFQVFLTLMEWWKAPEDGWLWELLWTRNFWIIVDNKAYFGALAVDVGLTAVGYAPVVQPWVQTLLVDMLRPGWFAIDSWTNYLTMKLITWFGYVGVAIWPELRLVRREA